MEFELSVAFTKEESAGTASETLLPEPNLASCEFGYGKQG
jgi:hypothetical protein